MGSIKHFYRISSSKEFDFVYKKSDKTWHTPYFVLFYKNNPQYKVAFVASKKVGNAVMRNRAKRLLRAHFIEDIHRACNGYYILVAKKPILDAHFEDVSSQYKKVLKKLKLII